MGPGSKQQQIRLLAEVSHQINSPLAAIRNALYLAAQRSDDPQLLEYLALADEEVTSILSRMKELRETLNHSGRPEIVPPAPPTVQIMRKAA